MSGHGLTAQPIDAYLAAIDARLTGPRHARRAIIDELRDGVHEAVSAYQHRGLTAQAATAAAIEEFGDALVVASSCAGELAIVQARRTTVAYLLSGPFVGISWLLLLAPPDWWRRGLGALWSSIPALPLVAVSCAAGLLVLAGTGRPSRWLHIDPHRLLDLTLLLGLGCMAGDLLVLAVLARTMAVTPFAPTEALVVIAVAASLIRLACSPIAVMRFRRTCAALAGSSDHCEG